MAKKPKTISYYQKKLKQKDKEINVYQNTLAYLVDSEDDKQLIERMGEYKKLLK